MFFKFRHFFRLILVIAKVEYFKSNLEKMAAYLGSNSVKPCDMVHVREKTMWEKHGSSAVIRCGEWVDVLYNYQPANQGYALVEASVALLE